MNEWVDTVFPPLRPAGLIYYYFGIACTISEKGSISVVMISWLFAKFDEKSSTMAKIGKKWWNHNFSKSFITYLPTETILIAQPSCGNIGKSGSFMFFWH